MNLSKIEHLDTVAVYRGQNGVWYGDVLFTPMADEALRPFPEGHAWRRDDRGRPWFEFSSWLPQSANWEMTDEEAHEEVCAEMAAFLLACRSLDRQEELAQQLLALGRNRVGRLYERRAS